MEKRIDQMTDEELGLAEDAALNEVRDGARQVDRAQNRIRDIHQERFQREFAKPRRRKKQS